MLLRFLISQGRCPEHLYASIPTFAHWRLSALPFYLQADQVEQVIASPDLATSLGRRNRAILLLLASPGASGERHCSASARRPRLERRHDPGFRKGTPPNRVANDPRGWRCAGGLHQRPSPPS
jgi:hypothetical protein